MDHTGPLSYVELLHRRHPPPQRKQQHLLLAAKSVPQAFDPQRHAKPPEEKPRKAISGDHTTAALTKNRRTPHAYPGPCAQARPVVNQGALAALRRSKATRSERANAASKQAADPCPSSKEGTSTGRFAAHDLCTALPENKPSVHSVAVQTEGFTRKPSSSLASQEKHEARAPTTESPHSAFSLSLLIPKPATPLRSRAPGSSPKCLTSSKSRTATGGARCDFSNRS